jgi:hypothetical protein
LHLNIVTWGERGEISTESGSIICPCFLFLDGDMFLRKPMNPHFYLSGFRKKSYLYFLVTCVISRANNNTIMLICKASVFLCTILHTSSVPFFILHRMFYLLFCSFRRKNICCQSSESVNLENMLH